MTNIDHPAFHALMDDLAQIAGRQLSTNVQISSHEAGSWMIRADLRQMVAHEIRLTQNQLESMEIEQIAEHLVAKVKLFTETLKEAQQAAEAAFWDVLRTRGDGG